MPPILTFLSDFGLSDPYVAAVKGVLLTHCPGLTVVDVCHDVRPHDVFEGAMILKDCYETFPDGTCHLAVVDPGVGSERPALVARSERYLFVGPDNGLLAPALEREKKLKLYRIEPDWEVPVDTFHGRDVFGPAAAKLLAGDAGTGFLARVESFRRLSVPHPSPVETGEDDVERWEGAVLRVDRFGNLVTNLFRTHFGELFEKYPFELTGPHGVSLTRLARSYDAAPDDTPVVIWGSSGTLEISVREGSAAEALGMKEPGASFEIAFRKGGQP